MAIFLLLTDLSPILYTDWEASPGAVRGPQRRETCHAEHEDFGINP